ncbi:MAG: peptide chain release factor N(5)-glutamine methyltransferase [Phycisphaerales bacterium]
MSEPWTTRRLQAWIAEAFARSEIESPRICAELLLGHVLQCDRLRLYTDADRPANADELGALRALVARALRHEPIQYLTGEGMFFGLTFSVDRRVLIPRPSTETIVEEVLQTLGPKRGSGAPREEGDDGPAGPGSAEGPLIADVCTGSGCIAIAILKHLPRARAMATDLSEGALAVAAANGARHGVLERLELLQGNLLVPVAERLPGVMGTGQGGARLDALVSNPPYIPDHEWPDVAANVRDHEPEIALRGGPEGVDCVAPILTEGPALLRKGGVLAIEIAACTAAAVLAMAQAHPRLEMARIVRDIDGLERVLVARATG